ncbi:nickel ABC transporter ATP-binding protein NikE [Cellulomonas triticagri]|uniref:ABC transporter ATP-binding protein n=1 Tax=Cellulomonas triticagri TaxID=2483352 RepID=A0A3M2J4U0_9CELL|nr:ABC transporter ATP-binding protein [Cellulomonas triticagri]RMI06533.1 ABC transporter ATP-binding protein [Cellulomonas triticagri]
MTGDTVLDIAGLRVGFPRGGEVLHGVDLRVAAGECVAVVGGSGAGKSVLARTLVGLAGEGARADVRADRFTLLGRDATAFTERAWRAARGRDVGLVLQDALGSLDPLRTVGAEVAEALQVRRSLDRATTADRVRAALADAGLDQPEVRARQRSGDLSGGMRQRALIASAVVARPPLLVADEPTTALDATVAARVLDLLARLRDEGTAVVLVTHDLGAVARVADRVVVLRDGVVVEEGLTAALLAAPREEYTRALVDAARLADGPGDVPAAGAPVLTGTGLRRTFPLPGGARVTAVDGVDLTVHAGEAVGLVGESGSGKTTLARMLLAADTPDAGQVLLDGGPWSARPERDRRPARAGVRLVPQDPLGTVDPRLTVRSVLHDALRTAPHPPARADRDAAATALLAAVHLPADVLDRRPRTLSGGQRQRVAIARALASEPRVLLLDEPVSALDVQVQAAVLDLLVELRRTRGVAMVLVSHDLGVVRRVCDRVLVMSGGRVVEEGPVADVLSAPTHAVTRALVAARGI